MTIVITIPIIIIIIIIIIMYYYKLDSTLNITISFDGNVVALMYPILVINIPIKVIP